MREAGVAPACPTSRHVWRVGATTVIVLLLAVPAWSQPQPGTSLRRVLVQHDGSDREIEGYLSELRPQSAVLLIDDRLLELPLDTIARIRTARDSVWNGAIIGAAIGGVWCAFVCGQGLDSGGQLPLAVLSTVGFWGAVGAGIDALHSGRETIYQRPSPVMAARPGAALSVRIRF